VHAPLHMSSLRFLPSGHRPLSVPPRIVQRENALSRPIRCEATGRHVTVTHASEVCADKSRVFTELFYRRAAKVGISRDLYTIIMYGIRSDPQMRFESEETAR
jgi:hypothetical protein